MDEALTNLQSLLSAGGIAHEPFVDGLAKRKITPEMFLERLQLATKQTEIMQPQNALGLRALHLESHNPVKIYNMLGHAATMADPDAGTLKKIGAGISSFGNARVLAKHYTGSGVRTVLKNGASLGTLFIGSDKPSEKRFAWPSFKKKTPDSDLLSERVLNTVEDVLNNFKPGRSKSATHHLAEFFDLSEKSVGGIVEAAQNLLKNPQWRVHIKAAVKNRSSGVAGTAIGSSEVYTVLNEVLAAVGKFHNPADTKRMADAISIMTSGTKDKPLDMLTQYWEASKTPLESLAHETPEIVETIVKAAHAAPVKIAFANKPIVNLGAAALTMGSTIYVGHHFGKGKEATAESVDEQGTKTIHTKTLPAGFWVKTAKFIGMTGLLAACGVALARAGAMPNAEGVSFAERVLKGREPAMKAATAAAATI